ncbi:hypothetical protein G4X40_16495 [Rhodococcus sp. D2-41]|uniref:Uncharacterized protein n=1 Tax=Speluncibacter jeojiensis TaxID=2710754 RepID=A0A9X4RDJ8_9ACTN|nr:hypothetical protein [Rhodococcus sp. D2-41]MDG3011746.1 hypothetical protein [Rhodococcus sp. D2-41]MDG3014900.1 hypothetical protein [Corynebacteriales bacterium D3-21]
MVVDDAVTGWVVEHRMPVLTAVFEVIPHLGGSRPPGEPDAELRRRIQLFYLN